VPVETVEAAVAGGVDAVHLRDPEASARELWTRAITLRPRLAGRAQLVVNDRVDVALAVGADGAQLGARSLPVSEVRRVLPELPLGVSVHSVDEAIAAAAAGAAWLVLGTIFASVSHPGEPGVGPALLGEASRLAGVPVIAIGGINPANASACVAAGAHGVAVISAIARAADPRAAAQALRRAIE
jgi:thiamine-phosphate diphosphorylase